MGVKSPNIPKDVKGCLGLKKAGVFLFIFSYSMDWRAKSYAPMGSREIRYPGLSPRQMSPVQLRSCKNGIAVSLPETNSLHLKNRPGPKRKRSYSNPPFSGAFAVSFGFRVATWVPHPEIIIFLSFPNWKSIHPWKNVSKTLLYHSVVSTSLGTNAAASRRAKFQQRNQDYGSSRRSSGASSGAPTPGKSKDSEFSSVSKTFPVLLEEGFSNPETNSLHLSGSHPKRKRSSSNHPFSGAMLVPRRVFDWKNKWGLF